MSHYKRTPEFEKEYKKLAAKYRTLDQDILTFEKIISVFPTGQGNKFSIIHSGEDFKIVKARLMCRALRGSSLRVVYAYHEKEITFMYIEIYFKGDKENENYERVKEYVKENSRKTE
jgi:mRNA-degrading endonuclease RelE of RelBE toxin-antitoxin system